MLQYRGTSCLSAYSFPERWPDPAVFGTDGVLITPDGVSTAETAAYDLLSQLLPSLRLRSMSRQTFLSGPGRSSWQTVVVSSQALGRCSLDILSAVRQRLSASGMCLLLGRMANKSLLESRRQGEPGDMVPVWTYTRAQARRCGLDLIVFAAQGPDNEALALFRKAEANPRWRLSTVHTQEAPYVRALFDEVFTPNTMSAEHWHWKYGDGRGVGIGAWTGQALSAHYGGIWRAVWWQGRRQQAVQITDVMVSSRQRGILRRDGAFSRAAASFPECFTGYGAKAIIGFGFPNERHFRAAALRQLYAEVDRIREITWPVGAKDPCRPQWSAASQLLTLSPDELKRNAPQVDLLWTKMSRSLDTSIVGIRDWPYIRHRYLNNPLHTYSFLLLRQRLTRRWLALAVLAQEGNDIHLRDLIGPLQRFPLLIARLRETAICRGRTLRAWITASHAHHLDGGSADSRDLGIVVPHSIWTAGPSVDSVKDRWWLMSGDTDFL